MVRTGPGQLCANVREQAHQHVVPEYAGGQLGLRTHLARVPILIVQPDRDVVPVESVLFYFKRAPDPSD